MGRTFRANPYLQRNDWVLRESTYSGARKVRSDQKGHAPAWDEVWADQENGLSFGVFGVTPCSREEKKREKKTADLMTNLLPEQTWKK